MFRNSLLIDEIAGELIADANGVTMLMEDNMPTINRFLDEVKLRGIAGSSWDSQPTTPARRSDTGIHSTSSVVICSDQSLGIVFPMMCCSVDWLKNADKNRPTTQRLGAVVLCESPGKRM